MSICVESDTCLLVILVEMNAITPHISKKLLVPCFSHLRSKGGENGKMLPGAGAQIHLQSSMKPNPLRDGDGKSRVPVHFADSSFAVFLSFLRLRFSKTAELLGVTSLRSHCALQSLSYFDPLAHGA